eukprot:1199837-Alexandrium_andersonii.AAC.1
MCLQGLPDPPPSSSRAVLSPRPPGLLPTNWRERQMLEVFWAKARGMWWAGHCGSNPEGRPHP